MNVAVIGAGAAGLVTAHELNRAGHEVTVIEQLGHVAGVWQYHEGVEEDLLGSGKHGNNPRRCVSLGDRGTMGASNDLPYGHAGAG